MDLEMTGLDPDEHRILEVAAIITDFKLKELNKYHAYIKQPGLQLEKMKQAPWYDWTGGVRTLRGTVYDMATNNGLIDSVKKHGKSQGQVEKELIALVKENFEQQPILAGNSIHQDRRFIRRWWPKLEKLLHYRMLDVSSFKVYMQGRYEVDWKKPDEHKALEDIRGSIKELDYYSKKIKA